MNRVKIKQLEILISWYQDFDPRDFHDVQEFPKEISRFEILITRYQILQPFYFHPIHTKSAYVLVLQYYQLRIKVYAPILRILDFRILKILDFKDFPSSSWKSRDYRKSKSWPKWFWFWTSQQQYYASTSICFNLKKIVLL